MSLILSEVFGGEQVSSCQWCKSSLSTIAPKQFKKISVSALLYSLEK